MLMARIHIIEKVLLFFGRKADHSKSLVLPSNFTEVSAEEIDERMNNMVHRNTSFLSQASHILTDNSLGEHEIEFDFQDTLLNVMARKRVTAYHIKTLQNWNEFTIILKRAEHDPENYEGEEYNPFILNDINDFINLRLPVCNCSDYIGSTTTIYKNYIDENADVNASLLGTKAERVYFFFIEELNKYAVVYGKYFCL